MPLARTAPPRTAQWLRRRIANREVMRRHRAANRDKRLCAGVDLTLDAGTCGRLVWPAHERCYACHLRRQCLHALNPAEVTVAAATPACAGSAERASSPAAVNATASPRSPSRSSPRTE